MKINNKSSTEKIIATTVKIEKSLYDSFKILGIQNNNLTLQTFVDRCVYLYVNDTDHTSSFRHIVNDFIKPVLLSYTGSFPQNF